MRLYSSARLPIAAMLLAIVAGCTANDGPVAALQPPSAFAEAERSNTTATELFADEAADAEASAETAIGRAEDRSAADRTVTEQADVVAIPPNDMGVGAGSGIRFTPVIGAPLDAVRPLSSRLRSAASGRGLPIKSYQDETSDHILKGYLAAESTEETTLVIFVWDVLDPAGNRLHRIRGVEEVAVRGRASGSDAWQTVPPDIMETIAERTITDYLA